ncbi:MAG: hypothetical protein ACXAC8_12090 [Candidatus Hodarchaeales archaeon]
MCPLDKKKLDALLDEIKTLEEKSGKIPSGLSLPSSLKIEDPVLPTKKDYLLATEKKAYLQISHHMKLVMLSIDDTATALEIWLKGVLPLLLTFHSIELEEWERICDIGDSDLGVQQELVNDWKEFFENKITKGQVNPEILVLIDEGKRRVEKMREQPLLS